MTGQAESDRVAYETPAEMLAEKFHMARSFLEQLNPGADFGRPGTTITVVRPGGDDNLAYVQRIEVDKSVNELRAFSANGEEVATYPIKVGSNVHPSPNDRLEILSVAPGPNNPVGMVWIDLSRDGYGCWPGWRWFPNATIHRTD